MKSLAFLFVAAATMTFASCGNNTQASAEASDSDTVAVDTMAQDTVDTTAVDTTAADSVVAE